VLLKGFRWFLGLWGGLFSRFSSPAAAKQRRDVGAMPAAPQAGGSRGAAPHGAVQERPQNENGAGSPLCCHCQLDVSHNTGTGATRTGCDEPPPSSPSGLDLPLQGWLSRGGCWHHLALDLFHQPAGGGCFLLFNPVFGLNSPSLCPPASNERGIAASWVQPPKISPSFPHKAPIQFQGSPSGSPRAWPAPGTCFTPQLRFIDAAAFSSTRAKAGGRCERVQGGEEGCLLCLSEGKGQKAGRKINMAPNGLCCQSPAGISKTLHGNWWLWAITHHPQPLVLQLSLPMSHG